MVLGVGGTNSCKGLWSVCVCMTEIQLDLISNSAISNFLYLCLYCVYVCGHAHGSLGWVFFHNLGPRDQTLSGLAASILPLNHPASQHGAAVSFFICKGQLARASLRLRCEAV